MATAEGGRGGMPRSGIIAGLTHVTDWLSVGFGDNLQIFPRNTLRGTPHATDSQSIAFGCLQIYCGNLQMYRCSLQM